MYRIKKLADPTSIKINNQKLYSFYTDYLNIDLYSSPIKELHVETDLITKRYPDSLFNNPKQPQRNKYTGNNYTKRFSSTYLKKFFIKDIDKLKELDQVESIIAEHNVTPSNLNLKHSDILPLINKLELSYSFFRECVDLQLKLPYKHQRYLYHLLNNKNYAAHIKQKRNCQQQFVYRLDVDTHDPYFIENHIDVTSILKKLIKTIDRKCNILFPEISTISSGAHIYIGFKEFGSYALNRKNIQIYFDQILRYFIDKDLKQPDLHGKLKIEYPINTAFALPFNSVYEYYDIKTDRMIDQITFYKEFIDQAFIAKNEQNILGNDYITFPNLSKPKKKYLTLKNITKVIERQKRLLNKESVEIIEQETIIQTGWEKQKGIEKCDPMFYDSNLIITTGFRVVQTKAIINKMLSYNYYYTFEQFMQLIKNHVVSSNDINKWSTDQFERNYRSFYDYYEKMYQQNSVNSIKPQSFYSNLNLIPHNLERRFDKIAKSLIEREYSNNKYKTKDSLQLDIVNTQLILKEIVGYAIYITKGNKSSIKSDIRLSKKNRQIAESNINLGRVWLKDLKEHYGLIDINVERLFKLIIDKSGLFKRECYSEGRSYLNLKEIRVATTFNFKAWVDVKNCLNIIDWLTGWFSGLDKGIKYFIMCKRVIINRYIFNQNSNPTTLNLNSC